MRGRLREEREGRKGGGQFTVVKAEEDERRADRTRAATPHRKEKEGGVTELVKLRVDSRRAGHGTQQPGFEEGGPTVDQTPLSTHVILREEEGGREEELLDPVIYLKIQTVIKCSPSSTFQTKVINMRQRTVFGHLRVRGTVHTQTLQTRATRL